MNNLTLFSLVKLFHDFTSKCASQSYLPFKHLLPLDGSDTIAAVHFAGNAKIFGQSTEMAVNLSLRVAKKVAPSVVQK